MRMAGYRTLGFWTQTIEQPETALLLWPGNLIEPAWDVHERHAVSDYLRTKGERTMAFCGTSTCRLCGDPCNGASEFSDGTYLWPEGYYHYVAHHKVKPPEHFIAHVLGPR